MRRYGLLIGYDFHIGSDAFDFAVTSEVKRQHSAARCFQFRREPRK